MAPDSGSGAGEVRSRRAACRARATEGSAGGGKKENSGDGDDGEAPVRSHVVVTMMARSITVERSVPALLRSLEFPVGAARRGTVFILYQGLKVDLQEF